ncbi:MAG TPA: glycosyltransferase [Tepidisphaeraceae bacterium]
MNPANANIPVAHVSVALCTWNGEKFLRAQLDSIASQTMPAQEIVVCDDCSTDTTQQIIRDFAGRCNIPVRFEINAARLGVTRNFQKTISLCTGQIIFLCDQDDVWRDDKVAKLVARFDDPEIGLAFSNAEVVRKDLSPAGYDLWQSIWFNAAEQERVRSENTLPVLLRHSVAAGSTLAFRASYVPMILPIPDLPHCHDIWITLLIACVGKIHPLNENLVRHRLHSANTVGMQNHNLLSQIKMAKWQINSGAFKYAGDLHEAALDRLRQFAAKDSRFDRNAELLAEKIRHSRLRQDMPKSWLHRLRPIADELRAGNYGKYSYGLKSVLQDLFLR